MSRRKVMAQPTIKYDEIHVYRRSDGFWTARGIFGDYGISRKRKEAIKIAVDVVATTGKYVVVVWKWTNKRCYRVEFRIIRVKNIRATSQFFQDSVP